MWDLPPNTKPDDEGGDSRPGMPRWVKAFWIVAVVVILLVVVSLLIGAEHGPGRHRSAGDARMGSHRQRATVVALEPTARPSSLRFEVRGRVTIT